MDKKIYRASEIEDKILAGIDFYVGPVSSTLGPKGSNVLFETDRGEKVMTNDGVTIARNLSSADPITQTVVDVLKGAALSTNTGGGDGTTTTSTLAGVSAKEAFKLRKEGYSWVQIRDEMNSLRDKMLQRLEKARIKPDGKKGLKEIAIISANNDEEVAANVIKAIDVAKEDGMVFLEPSGRAETELIEDLGFMVTGGIPYQELLTQPGKQTVAFKNAPVLLTDKKLYYAEEAETILRTAVKAGHKNVVIVAKDFMGEALNTFVANHTKGVIHVMLVKTDTNEKGTERLQDLSIYIGGKILSEKTGSLVNKITAEDFVIVNQAFADPVKTLFTPRTSGGKKLKERIAMLKEALEKDKDNEELKSRLASLTTGVVTIKIGGNTAIEAREKMYRYEDALHATRSAMKHGYLVGGGATLLHIYNPADCPNKDFLPLYRKFCEAILRKIASNAGQHEDTVIKTVKSLKYPQGYNARTDKYEDLLKAGVIDPYMVVKLAIENSISVATTLVSIEYYMVNDIEDGDNEEEAGA